MPIFDYECQNCKSVQEIVTTSASQTPKVICEECGSEDMKRLLGTFGFELKGEAWARDGYTYEYTKSLANAEARQYPVYGRKGVQKKLEAMRMKERKEE